MGNVYIVQESPGKNVLGAADYGRLTVLLTADRQVLFSPGQVLWELRNRLSKFCDDDYLVLIGDPVALALAFCVAAEANQGRVKVLKWDKQDVRYYPITIELYPQRGGDPP